MGFGEVFYKFYYHWIASFGHSIQSYSYVLGTRNLELVEVHAEYNRKESAV